MTPDTAPDRRGQLSRRQLGDGWVSGVEQPLHGSHQQDVGLLNKVGQADTNGDCGSVKVGIGGVHGEVQDSLDPPPDEAVKLLLLPLGQHPKPQAVGETRGDKRP